MSGFVTQSDHREQSDGNGLVGHVPSLHCHCRGAALLPGLSTHFFSEFPKIQLANALLLRFRRFRRLVEEGSDLAQELAGWLAHRASELRADPVVAVVSCRVPHPASDMRAV